MNLFIGNIQGSHALLSAEEAHHMNRVLRMKVGDQVYITDGKGHLYHGIIQETHSKNAVVRDLEKVEYTQKRDYQIHMAVAPTKQIDRIEYFIEKGIEVGLDAYTPIVCFHSERRKVNHERLNRIAISAIKQSLKADTTKVNDLIDFKKFILNNNFSGQKFIAHCDESIARVNIKDVLQPKQSYQFLIGPEGDFSQEEINFAINHGYTSISLGNQRMRTETAALSCVMLVHWAHL